MADQPYDVIVIGTGPGGYVAAIRAAQLGLRTAVVEREHLGGICLNWGCIPTKALLRTAEIYGYMNHPGQYGLTAEGVGYDVASIVKRSRGVSGQLNGGVGYLLNKNKVDIIWGEARIAAPGVVEVAEPSGKIVEPQAPKPKTKLGAGRYEAKNVIVATGARPRVLPGIEPDGERIWTYYEAMVPTEMPKSVLVMGSGAIGIEFASFYNAMGVDVTVVELLDQVLPVEDREIAQFAQKQFEKHGIEIMLGAKVSQVETTEGGVRATIEGEGGSQTVEAEKLISAIGVVGNTESIGLEEIGVEIERGVVRTDEYGQTSVDGIWAIGDIAGPPMLAHKAEHEGVICVEKIAGLDPHVMDKGKIPGCTYCHPQVASVGYTEASAKEAGYEVRVGRFPFLGNGKAIALGEPDGLVKTIFDDRTGQLLGAHLVGAEVTELIQGFVIAMNLETTEEELMNAVFPHPTLSETMHESVLDAYDQVIHT